MIEIKTLEFAIGQFHLQVSLQVKNAEYFVLLGVTGSGKTMLLESLCGLRRASGGQVLLNGRDITRLEPRRRQVGYVPQDGALFDHLSVFDNITFAPRLQRIGAAKRRDLAEIIAAQLGITHLLPRKIQGLSGGERQRVALARALAAQHTILLLDEPVSSLDEPTRNSVCRELKKIQRNYALSVIHVCHSLEEAMLLGDRIGIMRDGRIMQCDTLEGLQNQPVNRYVAELLRLENIFAGHGDGQGIIYNYQKLIGPPVQGSLEFLVRPWQVELKAQPPAGQQFNAIPGTVRAINIKGPLVSLEIDAALPLTAYMSRVELREKAITTGKPVYAVFPPEAIHIFPAGE